MPKKLGIRELKARQWQVLKQMQTILSNYPFTASEVGAAMQRNVFPFMGRYYKGVTAKDINKLTSLKKKDEELAKRVMHKRLEAIGVRKK